MGAPIVHLYTSRPTTSGTSYRTCTATASTLSSFLSPNPTSKFTMARSDHELGCEGIHVVLHHEPPWAIVGSNSRRGVVANPDRSAYCQYFLILSYKRMHAETSFCPCTRHGSMHC